MFEAGSGLAGTKRGLGLILGWDQGLTWGRIALGSGFGKGYFLGWDLGLGWGMSWLRCGLKFLDCLDGFERIYHEAV